MDGSTATAGSDPRRRARPVIIVMVVVGVAVAVAVIVVAVQLLKAATWQEPAYPSLQENPDPSVHGTVAYLSDDTNCVRIIAAGGGRSQEVYCLPEQDVEKALKGLGKEQGPQLVVARPAGSSSPMFRMTDPPGPSFEPGWQKIVDVRTGEVENVPDSDAPGEANRDAASPGECRRAAARADRRGDGRARARGRLRLPTLLSVDVPPEQAYGMPAAFWSPDGEWIAADDGRLLVIVPDDPPVIRVLTDESTQGRFEGELSRFAVTGLDLLAPSG